LRARRVPSTWGLGPLELIEKRNLFFFCFFSRIHPAPPQRDFLFPPSCPARFLFPAVPEGAPWAPNPAGGGVFSWGKGGGGPERGATSGQAFSLGPRGGGGGNLFGGGGPPVGSGGIHPETPWLTFFFPNPRWETGIQTARGREDSWLSWTSAALTGPRLQGTFFFHGGGGDQAKGRATTRGTPVTGGGREKPGGGKPLQRLGADFRTFGPAAPGFFFQGSERPARGGTGGTGGVWGPEGFSPRVDEAGSASGRPKPNRLFGAYRGPRGAQRGFRAEGGQTTGLRACGPNLKSGGKCRRLTENYRKKQAAGGGWGDGGGGTRCGGAGSGNAGENGRRRKGRSCFFFPPGPTGREKNAGEDGRGFTFPRSSV